MLGSFMIFIGGEAKSSVSGYVGEAGSHRPLTGAIPLLTHTGTLGCWVSPLARCTPP